MFPSQPRHMSTWLIAARYRDRHLEPLPAAANYYQPNGGGMRSRANLFARTAARYAVILATSARRQASCLATQISVPARPRS